MSVICVGGSRPYPLNMVFAQKSLNRRKLKKQNSINELGQKSQSKSESLISKVNKEYICSYKKENLLNRSKLHAAILDKSETSKIIPLKKTDKDLCLDVYEKSEVMDIRKNTTDLKNYQRNIIYMLNDIMANAECRKYIKNSNT